MKDLASLLPIALLVVAFLLLVVRPARARRRQFEGLQTQLEVGQRVMLASGIFGEIAELDEETIGLLIAADVVITVNRHAVSRVIAPESDHESSTDL